MQMAKLGVALVKGRTGLSAAAPMDTEGSAAPASTQADSKNHVAPQEFKSLVGRNHSEFGSSRQQVTVPELSLMLGVRTEVCLAETCNPKLLSGGPTEIPSSKQDVMGQDRG